MAQFICTDCREGHHEACRGGSWCDCLHRPSRNARSAKTRVLDNGCPQCTVALRLEVTSLKLFEAPMMVSHSHGGAIFAGRLVS